MELQGIGWVGMDWNDLTQDSDRFSDNCEHNNEPSDYVKCNEFSD
jgi:hypothetical protein